MEKKSLLEQAEELKIKIDEAKTPEGKKEATDKLAVVERKLKDIEVDEENEKLAKTHRNESDEEKVEEKVTNTEEILALTPKTYKVKKGEGENVHLRIERKAFDKNTGERQSKPYIQIMDPKSFKNFADNSVALGYSVDVLHKPKGMKIGKVGVQPPKKKK